MNRALSIILLTLVFLTYQVIFLNKFFPGIYIGDTNLTFMTKPQALRLLTAKFNQRANQSIVNIDLSTASVKADLGKSADEAFLIGHSGPGINRLADQILAIFEKRVTSPETSFNIDNQLQPISDNVFKAPKDATLSLTGEITPGEDGQELDKDKLVQQINDYLIFGRKPISLPIKVATPKVTTAKVTVVKNYLELNSKDPVKLSFENFNWVIDNKTLLSMLNLEEGPVLDKNKLINYLKTISAKINQPLKEAQFNFNPATGRVSAFQPAQEGRELDIDKLASLIQLSLDDKRPKNITLPVNIVEPKIATNEVNNLGIKELIGEGISNFAGSIPNRIYNVGLTASRLNGVLVPPNSIFSFNATVGDISAATGFKQAYVIKEGRTVLDDGGGVCQDSTTLFRAVLNAGLPIIKRTAHAYRVGYYEQGFPPGLDATVFYPTVDFQFKNDTGAHILIQAHTEGVTLYVDLYGTSDGRTVTLSKPVVTDITPAPTELRQDDPTLPKGVVKQVDFAAAGAKVSFNRTVIRNEETLINETWKSNYRPWQAVFLVGVGG